MELERRLLAIKTLVASQRERARGLVEVENLQSGMTTLLKDIESKRRFIDSCEGLVVEDDTSESSSDRDEVNITKKLRECRVSSTREYSKALKK